MILSSLWDPGMSEGKNLSEDEAQEIGRSFLLERYPRAKITFSGVKYTTTEGTAPSYCVEGTIKVHSGTLVSQFLWPPDVYSFKIWVSAQAARILTWEMH